MLCTTFLFVGCSEKLNGLYVTDVMGIKMSYEFSDDEVTMSIGGVGALNGTYEIKDDEIIITYNELDQSETRTFKKDGKDIIIDGLLFELED